MTDTVGLLQLGQCWFAARALLQLLALLQSPLLAALQESPEILVFLMLMNNSGSSQVVIRQKHVTLI